MVDAEGSWNKYQVLREFKRRFPGVCADGPLKALSVDQIVGRIDTQCRNYGRYANEQPETNAVTTPYWDAAGRMIDSGSIYSNEQLSKFALYCVFPIKIQGEETFMKKDAVREPSSRYARVEDIDDLNREIDKLYDAIESLCESIDSLSDDEDVDESPGKLPPYIDPKRLSDRHLLHVIWVYSYIYPEIVARITGGGGYTREYKLECFKTAGGQYNNSEGLYFLSPRARRVYECILRDFYKVAGVPPVEDPYIPTPEPLPPSQWRRHQTRRNYVEYDYE